MKNSITINGTEINLIQHVDCLLVPIKPICEALEIDFSGQRKFLREHALLSRSLFLHKNKSKDNKCYEMLHLPLKYVLGWIFEIDPRKVKPSSVESLIKLQIETYDKIYDKLSEQVTLQVNALLN